jgi:hypothetical protein
MINDMWLRLRRRHTTRQQNNFEDLATLSWPSKGTAGWIRHLAVAESGHWRIVDDGSSCWDCEAEQACWVHIKQRERHTDT